MAVTVLPSIRLDRHDSLGIVTLTRDPSVAEILEPWSVSGK
jgi:hypothetical protein